MNDIDVTVYFNEHRLAALDEVLNDQGRTIEGVLRKCFEETYASLVPEEKREEIEALIRQEEAQAQREAEACLLYTSPSPREGATSRMPSSA